MTSTLPEQQRFCLGCGYPLNELPEPRCPECGRRFNPGDAATFFSYRPPSAWESLLMRPVGWPSHAIAFGVFLLGFWYATRPGGLRGESGLMVMGCPWAALMGYWIIRWLGQSKVLEKLFPSGSISQHPSNRALPWLVVPALMLLQILVVRVDLPVHVGFMVSRAALERVRLAGPPAYSGGGGIWAGVYRISSVQADPGGTRLLIGDAKNGLLHDSGFYHTLGPPPPDKHTGAEGTYYEHLTGPWYAWYRVIE